ncbi:MAG: FAD-binding oxidoreductase, partial [Candidatus Binatia bacterium]
MKVSSEELRTTLEKELGLEAIESDSRVLASYAVDGKVPSLLCFPSTPEQVGAILRVCAKDEAAVIPWGGGTSMRLGNIPRRADVFVGLEKLDRLIEHDDANLTATAQAGTQVSSFQEALGRRRQFFPVDPPHPMRATLGGIVAANINGPRRMLHGGLRDLVIGMKMVLATGEQVKTGGKVVKNVAGYNLCKLFAGSLGTLGIITELTFRTAPVPENAASFVASGPLDRCGRFVEQLFASPLLPSAVTILGPGAAPALGYNPEKRAVAAWLEGFEEAIARHLADMVGLARDAGLASEALRDEPHRRLWEGVVNFDAADEEILYRITVPVASVVEAVAAAEQWSEYRKPARYVAHVGTGTIWLVDAGPAGIGWRRIAALARDYKGHAVMAAAPAARKEGIDVWGE